MAKLQGISKESPIPTAEQFLSALQADNVTFEVPEIGEGVRVTVKPLTLEDRAEARFRSKEGDRINEAKFTAITVLKGLVAPKLGEAEIGKLMAAGNVRALDKIAAKVWEISGLGKANEEKDPKNG